MNIDKQIFEKFPGLTIGIVKAKGIDNKGINEELIQLLRDKEKEIKENFQKDKLSENPKIGCWRKAYSSFGAKPKKYRCSVENLYIMILDGIELKHYSKLVDIYNYISIKHMIPVGGDDMDNVDGEVILKFADGTETFKELNSDEIKNPQEGEVIYKDDKEVLCRRWNWRECDKSKMTENTTNVNLVIEGLNPFSKDDIEMITNELAELVKKYVGGEIETEIISE